MYLNSVTDLADQRKGGTVFYHEFGHFIVYEENWIKDGRCQGEFAEFEKSLKDEVSSYINSIEEKYTQEGITLGYSGDDLDLYVKSKTRVEISDEICGSSNEYFNVYDGLSDIIDGVSHDEYTPSWGHPCDEKGNSYWDGNPTRLANEAFAEIYAAQMTGDVEEIEKMKEIMPNTYSIYMDMIENARG